MTSLAAAPDTLAGLPSEVLDVALWRAATDAAFRSRLRAVPASALAECGLPAAWGAIGPLRVVDDPADGDAAPSWDGATLVLPPLLGPDAALSAVDLGLPGTIELAADWCITSCSFSFSMPPVCTDGPTYCSVQEY